MRKVPGTGSLWGLEGSPICADLGLFQEPHLVAYRAAAPAGRQYPAGGLRHPVPLPSQSPGPVPGGTGQNHLGGPHGPELWVKGADLMDGTPIYDIKPYVPTPMPVPTHGAASPRGRTAPWRSGVPRTFWPNCRKTSGGPFWDPVSGPPAPLPERSGPDLRYGLRRMECKVPHCRRKCNCNFH